MGASLPALIQWHACEGGRGLCRCGVAAWGKGEAHGGLGRLTKGRARGGAHVSRWHVRGRAAGCAALAAACGANGRGAAASQYRRVCTWFVTRTRAHPARLGQQAADRAKRPPRPVGGLTGQGRRAGSTLSTLAPVDTSGLLGGKVFTASA